MIFTYDDLQRLKKACDGNPHYITHDTMRALISRLEAAEEVVRGVIHVTHTNFEDTTVALMALPKLVEEWRKTRGLI